MKIKIGPYKNYFGPYQLAEKILFWMDKNEDDHVFKFGEFLAGGKRRIKIKNEDGSHRYEKQDNDSLLYKFLLWIDSKKKPTIKIRIDPYDTWSMDSTLGLIVLPMLKQLRDTKQGSAMVDLEDVPEELRVVRYEDWNEQLQFKFEDDAQYQTESWNMTEKRWNYVLDEMIFAFEHLNDDSWEETFRSGTIDHTWIPVNSKGDVVSEDDAKLFQMGKGPNHTYECDYEGMNKIYKRMDNGFRLFGKYYRNLWS